MDAKIETNYYTLTPLPKLLMITILSAWDDRVVDDYIADLKGVTDRFYAKRPWAVFIDLSHWELNTPEAENKLWESNRNYSNNPTHAAFVIGDSETKRWQMENMLKGVENFIPRLFLNRQEASAWLNQLGYNLPESL